MRRLLIAGAVILVVVGAFGASASSGKAHKRYTIAFVPDEGLNPRIKAIARGGRAAAARLGLRFILAPAPSPFAADPTAVYTSLIARHVDAIATEGYEPALTPILDKVRAAGIELVAAGDDIAAKRALWVSQSDPVAYAQALADALASQLKGKGEYAIAREPGQFPIADEWQRIVERYVTRAYPQMHFDGLVVGADPTGQPEPASVKAFMAAHPKLVGFVSVVPRATYGVAQAIMDEKKIGKVFSSGNGDGSFSDPLLATYVRSGAAELVYGADQTKVGYLAVWGAHYLLTGHSFKPGLYHVGGPIGSAWYHAAHQELRLGQPLTITKANVSVYVNTF